MDETITTVFDAQNVILETAAQIANRAYAELSDVSIQYQPGERFNPARRAARGGMASGQVFRADQGISNKGGLCLSLDESITRGRTEEEILEIHLIGSAAIRESITRWHPDLFAGLIVAEARHGRDYFARFKGKQNPGQLNLF